MQPLAETFAALSDPTRQAIVARLAQGEATVTELMTPFAISQPAISRHLKVLEDAGLIETRIAGQSRPRRLKPQALAEARDWLETCRRIWEANFTRLDALLDDMKREPGTQP